MYNQYTETIYWLVLHSYFAPFHPGNWYDDPKSLVFLGWVETNN